MLARRLRWLGAVSLAALCWNAVPAAAARYGFTPVSFTSGVVASAVAAELSLGVTHSGSYALFALTNDGPVPSTIIGTCFDDGAGVRDSMLVPIDGSGAGFGSGGSPASFPVPNLPYQFDASFWATADAPQDLGKQGVDNTGELVTIPFTLESERGIAEVLAALDAHLADPNSTVGALRVAGCVQSMGTTGQGDALVLAPVHTGLLGAVLLGFLGLIPAGLGMRRLA
jgi:hypothetical protein